MPKQKHQNVLFSVRTIFVFLTVAGLLLSSVWFAVWMPASGVSAATNETINFQARLQTAAGSLVPDGHYNVEFKLYDAESSSGSSQGDCAGDSNCLWVETRTGSNQVRVANGYLTVNLGSINDFDTDISWDQQLWLTMNVGGTDATPVWDGEMEPRLMLTAVPYAFLSRGLAIHSGGNSSTLGWEEQTATRELLLPDESGTVCLQASSECGFATSDNAFLQGGNEFDTVAVLGTNDSFGLNLRTNGTTRVSIAANGSAVTLGSNTDLILQGPTAYISNSQGQSGSEAFGLNARVHGNSSIALGSNATAGQASINSHSIAIGTNATAELQGGIAIGSNTEVAQSAIALGTSAEANASHSIAIGSNAVTTDSNQLVIGGSAASSYISQAYFGSGVTSAIPQSITINATGGDGSNIQGADLNLAGGRSTGTASGGDINFQISASGISSGSSLNNLSTVASLSGADGALTLQNATDSTSALHVLNAAGTATVLSADTENVRLGVGTDAPERALDLAVDTNGTDVSAFRVIQKGNGHAGMEFSLDNLNNSFFMGQDSSLAGAFVINSSTSAAALFQTPEYVQSDVRTDVIAEDDTVSQAFSSANTEGNLIVASIRWRSDDPDSVTCSDTQSNSYTTVRVERDDTNEVNIGVCYAVDISGGANTVTATFSAGSTSRSLHISEYSGIDSNDPIDVHTGQGGASGSTTPDGITSTAETTTQDGSLIYGAVVDSEYNPLSTTTITAGTGFTKRTDNSAMATEDMVQSEADSTAATFTFGDARDYSAVMVAFKAAVAEGGGPINDMFDNPLFVLSQTGAITIQNRIDSDEAFVVLNSSDMPLFQIDTENDRVYVGTPGGDTTGALMVLGNKTTTGDPTGVNGAMYYNEDLGKFRCYEDGTWKDCVGDGDVISSAFVQGGNSFGTTAELGTNDDNSIQIQTFGAVRATFDTNNTLYLGNGVAVAAPNNFVVSGTGSSATGVAGGNLTLQGGGATTGNANGGDLLLSGGTGSGTGVNGLVVIDTPSFSTATTQECDGSENPCMIDQSSVDGNGVISLLVTAPDVTVILPDPTNTTPGRLVYVTAENSVSEDFILSLNGGGSGNEVAMRKNTSATMIWNGSHWTAAGASNSTTLQAAYNNTLTSAGGADIVLNNTATSKGLTIRNNPTNPLIGEGLFEVQTSIGTNLFSVNNNINELVANGGAESESTFSTHWTALGTSTITRTTTPDQVATGIAAVSTEAGTTAGNGVRNHLGDDPDTETVYMISFAAKLADGSPAFSDLRVDYAPDGSSTGTECISGVEVVESSWTRVTCEVQTPATAVTDASILIYQESAPGSARTFYVDNLSMTLAESEGGIPNNVQIGGGILGGAPTLFTLDRSSAPPVSGGNDAYLGSMYYDTTSGRIQCYEANGWGSCGSAPDSIITLTPEYSGAVLNGTGIGTLSADFCANEDGVLTVNTGFCAQGESRNYYRWTSPQASQQTYSIYVSYKLPETFNAFESSNTIRLTALTDDMDNGTVDYEVFRSTGSAVISCGNQTEVTTPSANVWYQVPFDGDETQCGFEGGDYIIFKINVRAHNNANVYVENLDFTFTNN